MNKNKTEPPPGRGGARPGAGRPPSPPADRRISAPFRLSADALSATTLAALRAGISRSDWASRALLREAAADIATPTSAKPTVPRETKPPKTHKEKTP